MTATTATTYSVVPCDAQHDRDTVLGLWRRNLPEAAATRWDWLYEQGPARGFLLRTGNGDCVGSCGYMRRRMRIDGCDVEAGQAIDLNVDAEHRTIGPALRLQRAVAATIGSGGLRLIYSFPNPQSESVLRRIGYQPLGTFQRWAKLLRSESRLHGPLRSKWLTTAAGLVIDAGLRFTFREPKATPPVGARFEIVQRFDERFDALWQGTRDVRPIAGERTADYLNWRFADAPEGNYFALAMFAASGALTAYVVYRARGDAVAIADFFYEDVANWPILLSAFLQRMRRERVATVTAAYLGPAEPGNVLERFGFWRRPSTWQVMIHAGSKPADAASLEQASLLDSRRWWLTRADVDTDD